MRGFRAIVAALAAGAVSAAPATAYAGFCDDLSAVIADAANGFSAVQAGEITPKDGEPAVPKGKHMLLGDRCYVHPSGSMYRCAVENVASDVGTAFLARVATCALPRHEKDWVISGAMDFGDEASVLTDTTLKIAAPDGRVVTVMINTRVITKPLDKAGMYRYVNLRVFRDGDAK